MVDFKSNSMTFSLSEFLFCFFIVYLLLNPLNLGSQSFEKMGPYASVSFLRKQTSDEAFDGLFGLCSIDWK